MGVGGGGFAVGGGLAVKHLVGGGKHEGNLPLGAEGRQGAGGLYIHGVGLLGRLLTAVQLRERRRVNDRIGGQLCQPGGDNAGVGEVNGVQRDPRQWWNVVVVGALDAPGSLGRAAQVPAQKATSARDQKPPGRLGDRADDR